MTWMVVPPGFCGTNGVPCFFCKDKVEDCSHFFLCCKTFKANFSSLWQNLISKILLMNPADGTFICSFLNNLDQNNKILFLLGGLSLSFEVETSIMIRRFVSPAVGKYEKCEQINFVSRMPFGCLKNSSNFCYFCN